MQIPVRLIRFLGFKDGHLHFVGSSTPTTPEILPLAPAYHAPVAGLQQYQLCKATIHGGVVIMLEALPTRAP